MTHATRHGAGLTLTLNLLARLDQHDPATAHGPEPKMLKDLYPKPNPLTLIRMPYPNSTLSVYSTNDASRPNPNPNVALTLTLPFLLIPLTLP